ncbi:MAG: YnfA family protein [Nitrospirota bacterium]|nr:YnfA family protein [Nitrospirota bacterium]
MTQTAGLFILSALAEIVDSFLSYLWLRKDGSIWLVIPAALSLAAFVWLLTLHPAASGRVYAAYGGVYVATALVWLKVVDGEKLSAFDWTGAGIALLGMGVIVFGWTAKE